MASDTLWVAFGCEGSWNGPIVRCVWSLRPPFAEGQGRRASRAPFHTIPEDTVGTV